MHACISITGNSQGADRMNIGFVPRHLCSGPSVSYANLGMSFPLSELVFSLA